MRPASRRPLARISRRGPYLVLTRHFFERLFQNDMFPFGEQLKEKLYALLALLAALGGFVANSVLLKYMMVVPDIGRSWVERCYLLTLFMLLLGFGVVLAWDAVFLDKRDQANLMPLPLRTGTILGAKFSSLGAFVVMFTLAVNALVVFVVAIYLPQWQSSSIGFMLRYMAAHLLASAAANCSIFFFMAGVQAVLLLVLSPALYKRLSLVLRFAALAAIVFLLMVFVLNMGFWGRVMARMAALREASSPAVLAFPPMWFVGLYDVLIGSRAPLDLALARVGALAPLALALVYFSAMRLSYGKHLRRAGEVPSRAAGGSRLGRALANGFNTLVLRDPVERAVFGFFGKTLRASPVHKARLAGCAAVAIGLALIVLTLPGSARQGWTPANRNLLAVPLILSFFLLVGLRSLVNVPVAPDAVWVFELTETRRRKAYFRGMKKAIVVLVLLPVFAALVPLYVSVWTVPSAFLHLAYGTACGLILMELLFLRYPKIPFASLPAPGRAPLHFLWMAYVGGFLVYVVWMNGLEKWLFKVPFGFAYFFGAAGAVLAGLRLYEEVVVHRRLRVVFREEPVPVLITFPTED